MKGFTKLAPLFLALLTACGVDTANSSLKIVGGVPVRMNDPVQKSAVFFVDREGNIGCSGVLIAPNYVLSAAHCFGDSPWPGVHVAFALSIADVKFDGPRANARPVAYVKRHELYRGEFHDPRVPPYDLALIAFHGNIPGNYQPMVMLDRKIRLRHGDPVYLAGYGKTGDDGWRGKLHKVETFFGQLLPVAKEFEVGPNEGRGACGGDSGGPAYVRRGDDIFLVGTTSRGPTDKCSDGQVIYTDIRQYKEWIEKNGGFVIQTAR